MANVEWLLREAMDGWALRTGQRNTVDDDRWRSSIERLQLGPGLRVFLFEAAAHKDVTLEMRSETAAPRWLGGQVTISGCAQLDFLDGVRAQPSSDTALMFRPSRGGAQAAAYDFRAGTTFHSAGYSFELERVVRLFDGDVPEVLRGMIEGDFERSRILEMRTDNDMRFLARKLCGGGLNGPLRTLMMEGAVLQMLAAQADAAGKQRRTPRHRLAVHDKDAVHEARRLLLADMRRPPTLGELALAVGISEKRLNAGFRQLFGGTAFEVLRNERLAHAEAALRSPQASLKEIAFRVGYNHANNFINAFTKRYGAPPRQYVEGQRRDAH